MENICVCWILLQLRSNAVCVWLHNLWLYATSECQNSSPMKGQPVVQSNVEWQPERDSATCLLYVNYLFKIFFTVLVTLKNK